MRLPLWISKLTLKRATVHRELDVRRTCTRGAPNAYDTLGNVYAWSGRYQEAEEAFRAGLQKKADSEYNLVHLAYTLGWQGRFREAVAECKKLARAAANDGVKSRAYEGISWFYSRLGDQAKADEFARKAKQTSGAHIMQPDATPSGRGTRGSNRLGLWLLGEIALARGRNDEAVADFQKALHEADPIGAFDWREDCLADAYLRLGRLDEAIAEYQRVLGLNSNRALARYHLAAAFERKGTSKQARDEYQKFLEIWKRADADVPEIKQAKVALGRI